MIRIYRSLSDIASEARGRAVTIGNFDGVHIGHRSLFRRVTELGRAHGWVPSVLTFDPHPTKIVAPARAPKLLTTVGERIELMRSEGIEEVFVLPFDRSFSELAPDEFVQRVLVDGIGASAIVIGENFHFGKSQAGNVQALRALGDRLGFCTHVVRSFTMRGLTVSSSEVRRLITSGDVSFAGRLLTRPYALSGEVVPGFGVGSKQTVPTLNLRTSAEVMPANGVYITRTTDMSDGRQWNSITNVGTRPTFGGEGLTVETFLLSALDGPTPETIRVELLRRVRPEQKFESPEALKQQILRDVAKAQAFFRRLSRFVRRCG